MLRLMMFASMTFDDDDDDDDDDDGDAAREHTLAPIESSPSNKTAARCIGSAVECPLSRASTIACSIAFDVASVIVLCWSVMLQLFFIYLLLFVYYIVVYYMIPLR